MPNKVYICAAVRTPIGSFGGVFKSLSAPQLGAAAIKGALAKAGVAPEQVQEVLMGNVVSANLGQAPARQAALGAGIPNSVPCTQVNKVCSSGMKTVMFGAQSIMLGHNDLVVAGGMESMSNIPYYVPDARWGSKFGDRKLIDGLSKDGLTDAYDQNAMGVCADATAVKYEFSREDQDAYAIDSYKRSAAATEGGAFADEIVAVNVPQRRGDDLVVTEDEEYKKVKFEKIPALRPAFSKDGTVTAANASTINDGAAALVLVSETKMKELGLKPLAEIISFAGERSLCCSANGLWKRTWRRSGEDERPRRRCFSRPPTRHLRRQNYRYPGQCSSSKRRRVRPRYTLQWWRGSLGYCCQISRLIGGRFTGYCMGLWRNSLRL